MTICAVCLVALLSAPRSASAYRLNDSQIVWPFEGHGSGYSLVGDLTLAPFGGYVSFTASDGGSLALAAFGFSSESVNSVPGSGIDGIVMGPYGNASQVTSAPEGLIHPMSEYFGQTILLIDLVDQDGVAFDAAPPGPNYYRTAPDYAPDISLFESHTLALAQDVCIDLYLVSGTYLCSEGYGQHVWEPLFTITIDQFVDPVPEPAEATLASLALAAGLALVKRRLASRGPCGESPAVK